MPPSAPSFAPPLSLPSTRPRSPSPSPSASATRYLSTPAGELAFFRALIQHRPVGLDKHWEMLRVALHLRDHLAVEDHSRIGMGELWDKYRELFDEETLRTTWEGEQIDALEDGDEQGDSAAAPAPAASPQEDDWINVRFPRKDFTLLVPPSQFTPTIDESLFASLADRISQRAEREEGAPPSPLGGEVREFSLELPEEEEEEEEDEEEEQEPRGRETRGKSRKATESESPRKKKVKVSAPKVEAEEGGMEMSGSDLSELEDEEEEEEEEGDEDMDGEEGTEASRASDAEEYEDKASSLARVPSSTKRKRATRSASAPTSDAASTTLMTPAELKKEKSKLAMRAKRAKVKAEKEAAAAAAAASGGGGEAKPREKGRKKRG